MICVKATSSMFTTSTRNFFTPPSKSLLHHHHHHLHQPSSSLSFIITPKSSRTFAAKMSATKSETIEHIVLFKVKQETDQSKINSMINGLNGLISLDQVLHLTAGPIFRNQSSSSFKFTHLLHSRYKSKDDLSAYSSHPNHMSVVKESVLPICEDIMAVDWVATDLDEKTAVLKPGSAMRVKFLKLKKEEVLGGDEVKKKKGVLGVLEQSSFGENFSPARAKGFSIASIEVFRGLNELEEFYSNDDEKVEHQKELVDGLIVVDYVIPPPQSANL